MTRQKTRLLLIVLLILAAASAAAAPPSTLGYQGRLATAGGLPITATLSITFRLYDSPSGGSALWSEVQPAVGVDGGNLGVELGTIVALPASIWGRQLYLGMQIAGDSEMLPRPALTAAPYALRAGSTMKRTRFVSAEGTPAENGAALLATVAGINDATAQDPVVVELDAGTFDLGTTELVMPSHTVLAGQSQAATLVTAARGEPQPSAALTLAVSVLLSAHAGARDLTVRNTGIPTILDYGTAAIGAYLPFVYQGPTTGVRLERVTGETITPAGSLGQRVGIYLCASDSEVRNVTGRSIGGQFGMGLRSDCPASSGLLVDQLRVEARVSSLGLRGSYLAGSGIWRDLHVVIDTHPGVETVFGIRFLSVGGPIVQGLLQNPHVTIRGSDPVSAAQTALVEGIRLENGHVPRIERATIRIDQVKAVQVAGLRMVADDTVSETLHLDHADIRVSAVQNAALGAGFVTGLRLQGAAPQLRNSTFDVRCLAPGYNDCIGILQQQPGTGGGMQAGSLRLESSQVLARHDDPADASANTHGLVVVGTAAVRESTVRVVRTADLELHFAVRLDGGAANVRVHGSTLHADTPSNPANACSIGGPGNAELFGNVVFGQFGCGTGTVFNCAGNTRAGAGFLAAGCP